MTQPTQQTSTSAEGRGYVEPPMVSLPELGVEHLGQMIRVVGRDITLGQHNGPEKQYAGTLEAIHANKYRVKAVLLVPTRHSFSTPRVIEVTP